MSMELINEILTWAEDTLDQAGDLLNQRNTVPTEVRVLDGA